MNKMMIVVIDGCAPEYVTPEFAPDLYTLAKTEGFFKVVQSQLPSVTNVNHACILSGLTPKDTHVVGNYYYHPETGEEGFIEERGFMKAKTILQAFQEAGKTTALFTVKGKVLGVYGDGATYGLSEQTPDPELQAALNMPTPPSIYDGVSTKWIYDAALSCIKKYSPDLMYCTNNDYIFHHFAPGTDEANQQISYANEFIKKVHELEPDRQIYVTADHGMNQKTDLINVQHICDAAGLHVFCLPPLKDRYVANHIYQEGGMAYIFLKDTSERQAFLDLALKTPEIEKVMTAHDAAAMYSLPENEIGDYVLFSAPGCAFGEVEGKRLFTHESRTHGSLYERYVPLFAINPLVSADEYHYSKDIAAITMKELQKKA